MTFRRILHPTDFSPCSSAAFAVANSLAADSNAELLVLHVSPLTAVVRASGITLVKSDDSADLERRLHQCRPTSPGVPVTYRLEHGEPDVLIPGVAAEWKADLIVMGTHGRTGLLDRMFLGSVAETTIRDAGCPVLTVKGPVGPGTAGG
jgi:nucleotide-binding universal stress UspA family protein